MSNLFPTTLLGYSKKAVNDYLAKRSEEFSQNLLEKDREHKEELEMLRAQVERLTQENEQLQALRQEVADALISAKGYASDLKRQTEADDQAKRMMNTARQEAEARRIQNIANHISHLQQEFRSILERMDNELSSYQDEFLQIQTDKLTSSQEIKELYAQEVEEL